MRLFKRLRTPVLLCCFWLLITGTLFIACMGADAGKLFRPGPSLDESFQAAQASRISRAANLQGDRVGKDGPQDTAIASHVPERPAPRGAEPTLDELIPTHKPEPVQPQSQPAGPTGRPAAGPPGRENPGTAAPDAFTQGRDSFSASFALSVPAPPHEVSFQKSPAAWMIDLPGSWTRKGRETYSFAHPVVRKVRVLPLKNSVQFKLYYARQTTPGTLEPEVRVAGDTITITVRNP